MAGFLAVSVGLATFALSYRATLDSSSAERAAYAVPLDFTLNEGAALVAPRDAASPRALPGARAGRGRMAHPAPGRRRARARAARRSRRPSSACRRNALPLLHGWRGDFSSHSPAELARLLRPSGSASRSPACAIPRSATRLALPVRMTGSATQLVLVVQTRDGDAAQLRPPVPPKGVAGCCSVPVPPALRGGRVIAIQLQLPSNDQRSAAHGGAEGRNAAKGFAGTLVLGRLSAVTPAGACACRRSPPGAATAGVDVRSSGGSLTLRYVIDVSEQAVLRPRQPFDDRRLPVVASPDVAASAGAERRARALVRRPGRARAPRRRGDPLPDDPGLGRQLRRRRRGVARLGARRRRPALVDPRRALALGTAGAIGAASPPRCASRPSPRSTSASRAAIHSDLQSDPIARGIVSSLVAAAIAALALALLGVALATLGFLRDEGDSLFDLESQGAGPRALRACVRWRALGLALLGVLAGVGLGIGLAVATGRLLAVDATLAVPDPPLQRITPWITIAGAAAVLALLAAALVEASLHVAYRRGAAGRGVTGEQWAE